MKCPNCSSRLYVGQTINTGSGTVVRHRVCKACGYSASTEERLPAPQQQANNGRKG